MTFKELINELNNWLLNSDNIPKYVDDLVDEIEIAYEKEIKELNEYNDSLFRRKKEFKQKIEIQKKIINQQHDEILDLKDKQLFKEDFDIVKETQYWSNPRQKQSIYKYVLKDNEDYEKLESKGEE